MTRTALEWAAVAAFLAAATAALHPNAVLRPDDPPAYPAEVRRLADFFPEGDLPHFVEYLEQSADALRRGRVEFHVGEFDCPPTFLLPGAAVRVLTGWPPVRVVNAFALVGFWVGGLAAYGLFRDLGANGPTAAVAAAGLVGCNYLASAHHWGHLNNTQLAWMGFAFWATARLCRPGAGWRPAAGLGLAMGLQVLSSPSYTLYLAYAGLPAFAAGWWAVRWRRGEATRAEAGRFAAKLAAAVFLAAAVAAFYLVPRLGNPSPSYVPPVLGPVAFQKFVDMTDPAHPVLFIGFPLVVLGTLAVNWCCRHPRPETIALTATLGTAWAMTLPAVPGTPYWLMYHTMPLVDRVRTPVRFAPMALMMLLGLVAVYLSAWADGRRPAARWLAGGGLLAALLGGNWLVSPWYYAPGGRCFDSLTAALAGWVAP
jgi:hypothetical protein